MATAAIGRTPVPSMPWASRWRRERNLIRPPPLLVLVKHVLDLLRIGSLSEGELEQHPRLGRIELLRHDGPGLVVVDLDVAADDAVADAGRTHGHDSLGNRSLDRFERWCRHVAVADASDDQALRTAGDRGVD